MSEGPAGGHDSRPENPVSSPDAPDSVSASGADIHQLYKRGLDLLGRGSPAAAAQLLERAAAAEPRSRSVLEALARAQFDAGQYAAAAGNFRRIVEASPSDDYAQFGLGLALARTGDPGAAAEHLALAAAMCPITGTTPMPCAASAPPCGRGTRREKAFKIDRERGRGGQSRVRRERGPRGQSEPGLRGCPGPLSEHYDAALLDLDGVVYLGGSPIPGAADALAEAAKRGMKLAYVTNNASRSPNAIAAQLSAMGVPATATDIVTSAQAAAHVLADRLPAGAPVLVVGGTGLRLALRERGLRPVTTAADQPLAVVQGYSPDISYGLLAEAALALNAGALYVASNADATLPTPRGPQPGNGSLVQVLVTRDRARASRGREAGAAAARRVCAAGRREAAAGRRGPAGYRHRGRRPRRRGQPAGADRRHQAR